MKILHTVEFYAPSRGGAQEVVRQLSERLAGLGHEVTVATTRLANRDFGSLNGVKIESFDISGNQVHGYRGETDRYVNNICYDVGFNNLANFNRRFLEVKGVTPRQFRKQAEARFGAGDA